MLHIELYHPIFFRHPTMMPEFLELIRTNVHRLNGLMDVVFSGPDAKTHSYVALIKPPTLPLDTPTTGIHIAYILPLMGITSSDSSYKGMGKKIHQTITVSALLFDIKLNTIETSVAPDKPLVNHDDYHEWWKVVVKDLQPKLNDK